MESNITYNFNVKQILEQNVHHHRIRLVLARFAEWKNDSSLFLQPIECESVVWN